MLAFRAALIAAIGLALTRTAIGACPPDCVGGGRNASTDCFVEFGGIAATVDGCTDGNPSCDGDGIVNGVCTFPLSVCLNVVGDPACTSPGMAKLPTVEPAGNPAAQALANAIAALDPTRPGCTAPGLVVPLATPLTGVKGVVEKLTITAGAGRKRDRNKLLLTCRLSPLAPSLSQVIQPILERRCAVPACHTSAVGGIAPALDQPGLHAALVDVPSVNVPTLTLVHPGSLVQSYLARKYLGKRITDRTARMPNGCPDQPPASGCLSDAEIAAIAAWIQTGAPDN